MLLNPSQLNTSIWIHVTRATPRHVLGASERDGRSLRSVLWGCFDRKRPPFLHSGGWCYRWCCLISEGKPQYAFRTVYRRWGEPSLEHSEDCIQPEGVQVSCCWRLDSFFRHLRHSRYNVSTRSTLWASQQPFSGRGGTVRLV